MTPKISVLMPNYNGQKYLAKSIESFIDQEYDQKELIIIDGKSTDDSHHILRKYSDKYKNVIWINKSDGGISDPINIGVNECGGDIIGYLGSDDFLYNNLFATIAYNFKYINFDAIYFDSISWLIKKNKIFIRKCPKLSITKLNLIKYGTIVGLQNIYFKRNVFEKLNFNNSLKYAMDLDFLFQCVDNNLLFHYINQIASINTYDGNISQIYWKEQVKESLSIMNRHSDSIKEKAYYLLRLVKSNV